MIALCFGNLTGCEHYVSQENMSKWSKFNCFGLCQVFLYLQVFTTADLIKKGISEWCDWYHFN